MASGTTTTTDLITQTQEYLNQVAILYFTSIGVIQRDAGPVALLDSLPLRSDPNESMAKNIKTQNAARELASEIIKATKEIDTKVEALPGANSTVQQQLFELEKLNQANMEEAARLQDLASRGRAMLEGIRDAMRVIAKDQQSTSLSSNSTIV